MRYLIGLAISGVVAVAVAAIGTHGETVAYLIGLAVGLFGHWCCKQSYEPG